MKIFGLENSFIQKVIFTLKTETTLKTVVNLSDAVLSPTELEVLNLGLKFVPTPKQDPTAQLAPLIQNVVKRLPDGMESSAIHQTTTILADYNPKQDKTPDNLTPKQRAALKSLMKKRDPNLDSFLLTKATPPSY